MLALSLATVLFKVLFSSLSILFIAELSFLSCFVLLSLCLVTELHTELLHRIPSLFLYMETVYGYCGIRKALLYNGMHTLREVHGDLADFGPLIPKNVLEGFHYDFHLGTLYDGYDGMLSTMCGFVGDDSIKLTIRQ